MKKIIRKSELTGNACIEVPSSKSLSHRSLITAALADGTSEIYHPADNQDIAATIRVMTSLGAGFEVKEDRIVVHGSQGLIHYDQSIIDAGESGSTLRFLIPVSALSSDTVTFTGHGKLMERPQSVYEDIFCQKGLYFAKDNEYLKVKGPLQGGDYVVKGDVSSQFITGLLLALPLCEEDSTLRILPPFESESYVDLTLDSLKLAGIEIQRNGDIFTIRGNQKYHSFHGTVEGDASQMAFFVELSCIQQIPVDILNLRHDSRQGDMVMLDFARRMGAEIQEITDGYRIIPHPLHGTVCDLADCPDLGPALFALATQCEGTTVFLNCGRLRIKESDRIGAMEEELRKLGCQIESDENTVTVQGKTVLAENAVLDGHNDHRIVMALSVLASLADHTVIEGSQAVAKSYPDFFADLAELGIEVEG